MNFRFSFPFVFICFLMATLGMAVIDTFLKTELTPYGIVSFEFIYSVGRATEVLALWGEQGRVAAGISLGLDYLYLVVYSLCVCTALSIISEKFNKRKLSGDVLFMRLAYLFPVFALSDALENFGLIQVILLSGNEFWPVLAFYCAIFKFIGIVVSLMALLVGLFILWKTSNRHIL